MLSFPLCIRCSKSSRPVFPPIHYVPTGPHIRPGFSRKFCLHMKSTYCICLRHYAENRLLRVANGAGRHLFCKDLTGFSQDSSIRNGVTILYQSEDQVSNLWRAESESEACTSYGEEFPICSVFTF